MLRPAPALSPLIVIAAACAAIWGIWNWVVWLPDETNRLRDDAFYEFVWAANVAAGNGPTVSDGVDTSGVQWLWSMLLVLVAWIHPLLLPTVAPMLGLAFHAGSALLIWRLPQDRLTGICLGLCWLGHPLLLREAQNGQETAMAVFFAVSLFVARRARERGFVPLSLLAVLARTDLLGLVVMMSFCRQRKSRTLRGWLWALPAPVVAFSVPLVANLATSGTWLPDSALPMAWLFHTNLSEATGYWYNVWWYSRPVLLGGPFAMASAFGFGLVTFQLLRPWWPMSLRAVPAVMVGVASALGVNDLLTVGWAALLLALFPAQRRRRMHSELFAVSVGLSAIIVLHWALRWYPRDYYLAPVVLVGFVAMTRFGRWRLLLLTFAVVQIQDSWRVKPEPLAGQQEMSLAGFRLHEVVPAGERVACFNSGLVTWWSTIVASDEEKRRVVNLDGVVDSRSFAALRDGRLSEWLDEQGIRFVLDSPIQFELDPSVPHACGMHFGGGFDPAKDLVEVARFDVPGVSGAHPRADSMRLYWRRGRGEMPERPVPSGEMRVATPKRWASAPPPYPYPDVLLWWGAKVGQQLVFVCEGQRQVLAAPDVETAVLLRLDRAVIRQGTVEIESR